MFNLITQSSMHYYTNKLIKVFYRNFSPDCSRTVSSIDYYTRERGFRLQGNSFDHSGNFNGRVNYCGDIAHDVKEVIDAWNTKTAETPQRWNKAQFVVYHDGRSEVTSWWDDEFHLFMYGELS